MSEKVRMKRRIAGMLRKRIAEARLYDVPDTTMREALLHVEPTALRPSLHAIVRAAHRRKALEPEGLPFGVVSLDGKATALPSSDDHFAQRQTQSEGARLVGLLRTVTATLTSSVARPCIVRRLFLTEQMAAFGSFTHARTVLRVESETCDGRGQRLKHERRYFISSLPPARLTAQQWLRVVRSR